MTRWPLDPPMPGALAAPVARAGVDPAADRLAVADGVRWVIADRGGYLDWDYDDCGRVVLLLVPDREAFMGTTLPEALAWCLLWLMVEEFAERSTSRR